MKTNLKIFITAWCIALLGCGPAFAILTATVTPGYQFAPNELPTTDNLNLLAVPTISISGTVDGSTAISAGSVTGTMLADGVVDGLSIEYNGGSPRAIRLASTFTTLTNGLSGGGGVPVRVVTDPGLTIVISNNAIKLGQLTNLPPVNSWTNLTPTDTVFYIGPAGGTNSANGNTNGGNYAVSLVNMERATFQFMTNLPATSTLSTTDTIPISTANGFTNGINGQSVSLTNLSVWLANALNAINQQPQVRAAGFGTLTNTGWNLVYGYGISNLVKNSGGDYRVNLLTNLPGTNYVVSIHVTDPLFANAKPLWANIYSRSTNFFQFKTYADNTAPVTSVIDATGDTLDISLIR